MATKARGRKRKTKAEVQAFLAPYPAEVRSVALKLRDLVFDCAPEALEQIDLPARMLAYGFAQTYQDMICVIMPLKEAVNLGFPRGVDLADPRRLLAGTGKRARHVKLTAGQDVARPAIRALINASARQLQSRK